MRVVLWLDFPSAVVVQLLGFQVASEGYRSNDLPF